MRTPKKLERLGIPDGRTPSRHGSGHSLYRPVFYFSKAQIWSGDSSASLAMGADFLESTSVQTSTTMEEEPTQST